MSEVVSKGELDRATSALWIPAARRDRAGFRDDLFRAGVSVTVAPDLPAAVRSAGEQRFGLSLVDVDGRPALAMVRTLHAARPDLPIVAILDETQASLAGDVLHAGAVDVLAWPCDERDIAMMVTNVQDRASVPMADATPGATASPVFSRSIAMRQAMDAVEQHAASRSGLSLSGEAGTGRRLLARTLHQRGDPDGTRPFVEVDCDNVTPAELDQQLFGIGAEPVSGPSRSDLERIGRGSAVMQARGGTLYLTNLAEAPARVQARLARLLRDREALTGARRDVVDLDIRAVAAFEPPVEDRLRDGDLRMDLFERLAQARIDVPPLRRRREDISSLALHFLRVACAREGVAEKSFSRSSVALLSALPWPGNAPELRALVEALVPTVRQAVIQLDDLLERATLDGVATRIDAGVSLRDAKARFERDCISAVLVRHHGRVGEAAKALGIQRTNLYRKVRQLNVARSLLATRK